MLIGLRESLKELIKPLGGLNVLLTNGLDHLGESGELLVANVLLISVSVCLLVCIIRSWFTQNLINLLSGFYGFSVFTWARDFDSG